MRVVFRKGKRGICHWTAYPPKRRPVSSVGGTVGRGLPHDLLQFLVEREHGCRHGFWGCLVDGATFRSLVRAGRRRTATGRAVIAAHVGDLDEAELLAGNELAAWLAGEDTPLTPVLAATREQWLAMDDGEEITLEFTPVVTQTKRSQQRQARPKPAAGARGARPKPAAGARGARSKPAAGARGARLKPGG